MLPDPTSSAYRAVARAISYLNANQQRQPALAELAQHVGLSEYHLQRTFTAWAGVSPKQFLQYLTKESAKRRLHDAPVLDAALEAGLSGAGRLHDLLVSWEGVTPGDVRRLGSGLTIRYGYAPSPFGDCLVATTERGICKLAFFDDACQHLELEAELRADWPSAQLCRDDSAAHALLARAFAPATTAAPTPLRLLVRGSAFRLRVWQALLAIPAGELRSYREVSALIGAPGSVRAVASAIAHNDIAYLIPCHRVIRSCGAISGYRWGSVRKQALIAREASTRQATEQR